ncbi:MAG: hypothetical protein JWN48_4718 [Myxococcaceae bacterium]|nr:hypothetical protein [Myxococcaceae bacterium]
MSIGDVDSDPPENELADAPSEPPAGAEHVLVSRWPELSQVPPLALLAAGAALCHAVLFRLLLPLLVGQGLGLPALLALAAPYSLNLAACAGLVALSIGTIEVVRARDLTYMGRRVMIGALAGALITTLVIATFLPRGYVNPQLVLLAAGALHTLVVQLAMTTLRAQGSLAGRTTVALVAAASLFPLSSLIVRHAEPMSRWPFASEGIASLHALGELSYLLMPIAAAFVVVPWAADSSSRRGRLAGAIAVGCMAVLFGAAARIPNSLYGHVMYSTLRLEWALERASLGYAVPISLAVGAATAASFSRDPRHRQGGAGLWLWLAGGYNPLTPSRIFMTALAATLVCRAILGVGVGPSKKPS